MKTCSKCGRTLPFDCFYSHANHKYGLQSRCKDCVNKTSKERYHAILKHNPIYKSHVKEYAQKWHTRNKKKNNDRVRKNDRTKREMCIQHYGGKCECCGEDRYEFLAIDHIDGGGNQHRHILGNKIHRWLFNNNFPKGFRILCHNCNSALGHYGYCPHTIQQSNKVIGS